MIKFFLQLALEQAQKAYAIDEVPVGAVITYKGDIIAQAHNLVITEHDPVAHAEIIAIRKAAQVLQVNFLKGCDIYVTLEPCPMCASAISLARINRLYFGAYDAKSGGVEHGPRIYQQQATHHKPEYYGGIQEKECSKLLQDFFISKRGL